MNWGMYGGAYGGNRHSGGNRGYNRHGEREKGADYFVQDEVVGSATERRAPPAHSGAPPAHTGSQYPNYPAAASQMFGQHAPPQ